MNLIVFGKEIPIYGLAFFFGIAAAALVAIFLFKKRKIPFLNLVGSAIYTVVGGMIGAKLLFLAVTWSTVVEESRAFLEAGGSFFELAYWILSGGFVFYGGLIGGVIGLFVYCRQFKRPLSAIFDIYAVVLPLGHAFGRVGCFFAGCCYGMPYDGVFSYTYFVEGMLFDGAGKDALYGRSLFPVQLFEAAFLFLIFLTLCLLYRKFIHVEGLFVTLYLSMYSVTRFVLEFFRYDAIRGVYFGLSTSQWISIALFLCATAIGYKTASTSSQKSRR